MTNPAHFRQAQRLANDANAFSSRPVPVPTWERVVEALCAVAFVAIIAAYFIATWRI